MSNVKKTLWMGLIPKETKQQTSLIKWKILMLQILHTIVKKQVPHLRYDLQYAYHW